ncbi:hypothetical protein ACQ7DA_09690 [Zafaria sp. J156]|uniref:hypothetical protein n=1 Tax=Zafaria sp. J156 TaxID=3116490 RepID=UPI002E78AD3E|nr:hypothetical protein [Zafaria sp. J156]MEE1621901.1 hypothetical protein [Zafaria sp. J156]
MKTTLRVAALLGAATVLGLLTVQGTLALWSATASSGAQAVRTADFTVLVRTADGATSALGAGTSPVTLPPVTGLVKGGSRTTAVTLVNATDAGSGAFRARVTAGTPQVQGQLQSRLTVTVRPGTDAGCSAFRPGPGIDLAQGASGVLCVTTTLAAETPASLGGAGASVIIPLTAEQLP